MLHGAIFLFPVVLAALIADPATAYRGLAGWVAVFAIEILLCVIGAAFLVLILAKDRTVRYYKLAATTDPLTGILNRRGFFGGGGGLPARSCRVTAGSHGAGQRACL